jgi:hypothetical protein
LAVKFGPEGHKEWDFATKNLSFWELRSIGGRQNADGWKGFNAAQLSAFMFTTIDLGRIRLTKVEHP